MADVLCLVPVHTGEREDDINDENIVTVTEAADMAQSLQHFVMTRKMFWTVLDSGEIP
jgi:hypothetical protein